MMDTKATESFEVFPWNKNLETGISLIDEQHRQLVNILNILAAHLANLSSETDLDNIFNELIAYADYHFKSEEAVWHRYFKDDPQFIQHLQTHESFIEKIKELIASKAKISLEVMLGEILGFLVHWLAYHILDTDKRMAKVALAVQSGQPLAKAKEQADLEMSGAMQMLIDTVLTMYDSLSLRTMDLLREKAERKRAEEALKASEERWKFVLEGAGDGVWDWDIQSNELYHSTNCPSLVDLFKSDPNQTYSDSTIHSEDLIRLRVDLQNHLEGKTETFINKHRVIHGRGNLSWVLTRGKVTKRDGNGRPLRMIGTHTDITDRELSSVVFNNTTEGILITDSDNNIILVNPSFTNITGYSAEEVMGKNPNILSSLKHDQAFFQGMWSAIESTGQWEGEVWNRHKDGRIYPEWVSINTIMNPDGSTQYRIAVFWDISERKYAEEKIENLAFFDQLTGLPNRRLLQDRLSQEIKIVQRNLSIVALLFIGLDHFKQVNDTFGHIVGDSMLIEVAKRLEKKIRNYDTLARYDGDTFVIILSQQNNSINIEHIAQNIITCLSEPFIIDEHEIFISASMGIALYPNDATESVNLIKTANQAMYSAKSHGRNNFQFCTKALQDAAELYSNLAKDLRHALKLNQFEVCYQPIIDLNDVHLNKAEALLRWKHPVYGLISPSVFIPIAEENKTIHAIGDWVFMHVAEQIKFWQSSISKDLQISINISPIQLVGDSHIKWINKLQELELSGRSIVIEITEGLLMSGDSKIINCLSKFHDTGIEVAIDDFGTGYSSLAYINKFDIDYLKIDQSFIKNMKARNTEFSLCEAIVAMAHKLGLKVVAEGVETQEQYELLKLINCDFVQGYLFSRAVSKSDFEKLLMNHTSEK